MLGPRDVQLPTGLWLADGERASPATRIPTLSRMPVLRGSRLGVLSELRRGSSSPTRTERGMDRAGRRCGVGRRCWGRVCADTGRELQQDNDGTDDKHWFHFDRGHRYGADPHGDELDSNDHDGHDHNTGDDQPHVIADHHVAMSLAADDRSGRRRAFTAGRCRRVGRVRFPRCASAGPMAPGVLVDAHRSLNVLSVPDCSA